MAIYILQVWYGTFTSTILLLGRSKGSFRGSLGPSRDRWSILRGPCAQFTSPTVLRSDSSFFSQVQRVWKQLQGPTPAFCWLPARPRRLTLPACQARPQLGMYVFNLEMFRIQLLMCQLNVEYNWSASWSSTLFPNLTEHIDTYWTWMNILHSGAGNGLSGSCALEKLGTQNTSRGRLGQKWLDKQRKEVKKSYCKLSSCPVIFQSSTILRLGPSQHCVLQGQLLHGSQRDMFENA